MMHSEQPDSSNVPTCNIAKTKNMHCKFVMADIILVKVVDASLPGFEPGTFGLEVQRAIHCATGT